MNRSIYLDYAAATPVDPKVKRAMEPYYSDDYYNPSANYLAGRKVRKSLNQARAEVAKCLGARPAEIVFTAGATEANNLAIQGAMRQFPDADVLLSAIEHDSVVNPARLFKHRQIPVDQKGHISVNKLGDLINDKTVLISVGLVNNEIGAVQPLREIADLIKAERQKRHQTNNVRPLWLHTDAAQAPNYLDLHVSRLGVDLMSINGGKIYGPKQSGVLYVRAGVKLQPLVLGGGQEFGLRSGTENISGTIGLATALNITQQNRKEEFNRVEALKNVFISKLQKTIPAVVINGSNKHTAPHIISATFIGVDNERLMIQLDEAGIQAATGSACNASSDEPSHVLSAIGLSDEQARSTLRFSMGRQTNETDIHRVIKLLQKFTTV